MKLGCSLAVALATATTLLVCEKSAFAGGFDELPDLGAQALGRGAAFTAKADDGSALYWNVAGLARQRGTKLHISANLQLNSFYFARSGAYADGPTDTATPWGGKPFPVVQDTQRSFAIPMLVASTDLGLDRLTVAAGVFTPAGSGKTFPLGVKGQPAPSRYDFIQSQSAVIFPTIGAAYRVTPQIDIGVAAHLVLAEFNELNIAYFDPGGGTCKSAEDSRCDAESNMKASGMGFTGSIGAMARPSSSLQIGAQLRAPASVTAVGEATTKLGASSLAPNKASVTLDLPWMMRAGVRYIGMEAKEKGSSHDKYEAWDVELDGTYETWGSAQNPGPAVTTTDPTSPDKPLTISSVHKWKDTFSIRAGGAYNFLFAEDWTVTARLGAFYDSSATNSAYTRLDVNTLAKIAGTAGLGIKKGAFAFNVAYAAVGSFSRIVTDGDIRPQNGAKGGSGVDGEDKLMGAVNNGEYRSFSHVFSFGIEVSFDKFFSSKERKVTYGDPDYENVPTTPENKPETKPASDDEAKKHEKKIASIDISQPDKKKTSNANGTLITKVADDGNAWWEPTTTSEASAPELDDESGASQPAPAQQAMKKKAGRGQASNKPKRRR